MSKKEKSQVPETESNFGDLFSGLKIDNLPPPPSAKKEPPKNVPLTPEQKKIASLDQADRELLKAFGEDLPVIGSNTPVKKGPKISMAIERKGHHGKTVTLVRGLKDLPMEEQMALTSKVKSGLGVGARFVDGILEVQGDQRTRLEAIIKN